MAQAVKHWTETTHFDLTDIAALRMGLSRPHREILHRNVMVPDSWGIFDKIRHYMPLCSILAGELTRDAICAVRSSSDETTGMEKWVMRCTSCRTREIHGMHVRFSQHARKIIPFMKNMSLGI